MIQMFDSNVIFSLPEGFTIGGVTSWAVELGNELEKSGYSTFLGIHPSRYNNPPVEFNLENNKMVIDCMDLFHPDEPNADPNSYFQRYKKGLPAVFIPNWSWGTYALAALMASRVPDFVRVIGVAHADESGYYQWLVHYESIIHKFIAVSPEIGDRLSRLLPHRKGDILIRSCPVHVPEVIFHKYSKKDEPIRLVYAGRIANHQKQVFKLLDLANELLLQKVNFEFRIIGGGIDKEEFDQRVNALPSDVKNCIHLENALPLSKMPEVWQTSDINILVSNFEGTSVSMLESMAQGCVPVMTAVSGTSAVINSGENGILVPVNDIEQMVDAIKSLACDREKLKSLGLKAHEKIKKSYSYDDYLPWFKELINNLWDLEPRPWPPTVPPLDFQDIHEKFMIISGGKSMCLSTRNIKKILFISHDANWGGAPKVIWSLIKGLDRKKWEPIVIIPCHGNMEEKFSTIGVRTEIFSLQNVITDTDLNIEQYAIFSLDLQQRVNLISDFILKEDIQVVVTNTICNFEGALAAKLVGIPHVWYVHEIASKDGKLTPSVDYSTFYGMIDSLSEKIVAISSAVYNEIFQFYPSSKIELIYTGIVDEYEGVCKKKEDVFKVSSETPVITYIGVLSKRKGVDKIVDVAEIVVKKHPEAKFILVGSNSDGSLERLQVQVKEKNLQNNFLFTGFRNDIKEILGSSDIVIVPSNVEPFSLVTIEAMACAKPVVATRSGGPEEIILDKETGYLVPITGYFEMANAIIHLIENPDICKSIGAIARKRFLEKFRYEDFIENFDNLLDIVSTNYLAQNFQTRKLEVERIIKLLVIAGDAKITFSKIRKKDHPYDEVQKLLSYSGYVPHQVEECSDFVKKKVSVCIPVYNGEKYLRQCINSILSQTYRDFELVIVNDNSSDGTKRVINTFHDKRIKYYENKKNLGLVKNWNRCIDLSSGEYICIFHQDDVMEQDNLLKKVNILSSNKNVGMVYSDTTIINSNSIQTGGHWFNLLLPNTDFFRSGRSFFDLLFSNLNIICCPSVMTKREVYEGIGGFDTRLPLSVDMEMWLRISLFYDIAYLSEPLIKYRWHDDNVTHDFLALDLIHVYLCKKMVLEKYPEIFAGKLYLEKLIEETTSRVLERAIHHYMIKEYWIAKQYLYFLQRIRENLKNKITADFQITELMKNVDQAVTLEWVSQLSK